MEPRIINGGRACGRLPVQSCDGWVTEDGVAYAAFTPAGRTRCGDESACVRTAPHSRSPAPLLGPHQYSPFFRSRCVSRPGLHLDPAFSGARRPRSLDSGRCGEQLGGIRGSGSGGDRDFGWDFVHSSSHRTSQAGALDVDWAHRRDCGWGGLELFAQLGIPDSFPLAHAKSRFLGSCGARNDRAFLILDNQQTTRS